MNVGLICPQLGCVSLGNKEKITRTKNIVPLLAKIWTEARPSHETKESPTDWEDNFLAGLRLRIIRAGSI